MHYSLIALLFISQRVMGENKIPNNCTQFGFLHVDKPLNPIWKMAFLLKQKLSRQRRMV